MGYLGQSINYDPDRVMSSVGLGQSSDKVHTDFFPFPLWDFQRLEQSGGSLMFSLNSLTNITLGDVNLQLLASFHATKIFSFRS